MTPKAAMAVHRVVATTTTRKPFVHVYWLKRPTTTTSSISSTSSTTSTSAWRDAVLKKYVKGDFQIGLEPKGKPFLLPSSSSLHFNVTHSDSLLGIAVASDLVGLDTEEERKRRRNKTNVLKLSKRRFSSMEVAQLEALPVEGDARLRRFLELWTLKESFLKATGLGISSPVGLRHCTFAFADDDDNDNDVGRRRRKRLSFGLDSKAAEAAADQMVYDDDDDETRLLRADDWRYCVYEPK